MLYSSVPEHSAHFCRVAASDTGAGEMPSVGRITKVPPTDIKEPPRHLPKFWHFSSSDDIANVEWEVCDCHLGNLDLLHGGEQAIQGSGF